jgi:hypothetical protein
MESSREIGNFRHSPESIRRSFTVIVHVPGGLDTIGKKRFIIHMTPRVYVLKGRPFGAYALTYSEKVL